MTVIMKGNYIFVQQGDKAFKVASNLTNYFELGMPGITEYYLEAKIEDEEFILNAVLLDQNGKLACRIINSFPEKSTCRKEMSPKGYRFLNPSNDLLVGIEVQDELCLIQGKIFDSSGRVVAESVNDDFLIYHGPAVLGRSGNTRGMVIE